MTVKELLLSVDFPSVAQALVERYGHTDSLRPIHIYKQDYDTLCYIAYSGEGRTIKIDAETGESEAYKFEGDGFDDITGSEVILTQDSPEIRVAAAAEILWCASPFGDVTDEQWDDFLETLQRPPVGSLTDCEKRARRFQFLQYLPYCRDKKMRREVLEEMERPVDDFTEVCFSWETSKWLIMRRRTKRKLNPSKRKREFRMEKRYEELVRLNEQHRLIDSLRPVIGPLTNEVTDAIMKSQSIRRENYRTNTFGKYDRIAYLTDLILNPAYKSLKSDSLLRDYKVYVCILYSSAQSPCSDEEYNRIAEMLSGWLDPKKWSLFKVTDNRLGCEVELEIITLG